MKILILLLVSAVASGVAASDPLAKERSDAKYEAWSWACELTSSCLEVPVPSVVYIELDGGLRGTYQGGDTIYVSPNLGGLDRMSTLIHEMIHYLHHKNGVVNVPGTPRETCWSEAEAFRLVDSWWELQGYPELKRGPEWWRAYWHCEPYYNPEWDLWEWLRRGFVRNEAPAD